MENHPFLWRRIHRVRRIQVCMARKAYYCHTWYMENHPFLWRRIRRVRRIQVCMARKAYYCHTWYMENHPFLWRRIRRVRRIQVCMARKAYYCHTWYMENHPFLWRRIRRIRRIQVCMARKGFFMNTLIDGRPQFTNILVFTNQKKTVFHKNWSPWKNEKRLYCQIPLWTFSMVPSNRSLSNGELSLHSQHTCMKTFKLALIISWEPNRGAKLEA